MCLFIQLGEAIRMEDLSEDLCCDPDLIKLEQITILTGVRQRFLQEEVGLNGTSLMLRICSHAGLRVLHLVNFRYVRCLGWVNE